PGLVFPARMDTGAETASLDARNIQRFERDGERWVRFDLPHPETGELIPMEQKLVRKARILQSISEESERRPVIQLSLSIGESTQLAEFTLSDRSHLTFPVLIGRNILKDVMVVDVSLSHAVPAKRKRTSERTAKETDTR
ncbi:ATP-dependent zinc protease, partial [Desulfobotulus sp.]|uniref:ATP-dependent zinc protease family protein n=1 Tax=Desulfobotulus sp. TaxID=1940337 RepID=UPI002A368E1B